MCCFSLLLTASTLTKLEAKETKALSADFLQFLAELEEVDNQLVGPIDMLEKPAASMPPKKGQAPQKDNKLNDSKNALKLVPQSATNDASAIEPSVTEPEKEEANHEI